MIEKQVYHGTGCYIEKFNTDYLGVGNDENGSGFYFSDSYKCAEQYAYMSGEKTGTPTIVVAEVILRQPIVVDKTKEENYGDITCPLTMSQIKQILTKYPGILEDTEDNPLADYMEEFWVSGPSIKLVHKLAERYFQAGTFGWLSLENFFGEHCDAYHRAVTAACGIDGVLVKLADKSNHIVAWFPDQIQIKTEDLLPGEQK